MFRYTEELEKSIANPAPNQASVNRALEDLCESSLQKHALLAKYNELKLKNIRVADSFVCFLAKLKHDSELIDELKGLSMLLPNDESTPYYSTETENRIQHHLDVNASGASSISSRARASSRFTSRHADHPTAASSMESTLMSSSATATRARRPVGGVFDDNRLMIESNAENVFSSFNTVNASHGSVTPAWLATNGKRDLLSDDYLPAYCDPGLQAADDEVANRPLTSMSVPEQESVLVEDLLALLQGNCGVYIIPAPLATQYSCRDFQVDENISPFLLEVINRILPVCSNFSFMCRFIADMTTFAAGSVNQALASAMRVVVKDYRILLCQFEQQFRSGDLGLTRLNYYLQDTASLFDQLRKVAMNIYAGECKGGATLSALYADYRAVGGVARLRDLMLFLVKSASIPFFSILQKWIYRGVISDPYNEFFVTINPDSPQLPANNRGGGVGESWWSAVHNDGDGTYSPPPGAVPNHEDVDLALFWEQHYLDVPSNVPQFLDPLAKKILDTGKYLNVVQQCAEAYEQPPLLDLDFEEDGESGGVGGGDHATNSFVDKIDQAHLYASNLLLNLMLKQHNLKDHLKSVKRYFLLDEADFIVHFMDVASDELTKYKSEASLYRLGSLLESAIRTSTATVDPFKDNLKVIFFQFKLFDQLLLLLRPASIDAPVNLDESPLSALDAFCIDYNVEWPVSLVLNRQILDRYQLLFRHLFYCKHVERSLCNAWHLGKLARRIVDCQSVALSSWLTTAFSLNQRMLAFVQHFQYYVTFEVIETTWNDFFQQIDKASNFDHLLNIHSKCLEICMDDCLMGCPELMALFSKLTSICLAFAQLIQGLLMTSPSSLLATLDPNSCSFRPSGDQASSIELLSKNLSTGVSLKPTDLPNRRRHQSLDPSAGDSAATVSLVSHDQLAAATKSVVKFDRKFNALLRSFLDQIGHYAKQRSNLASLASRLDFNEFYAQSSNQSVNVSNISSRSHSPASSRRRRRPVEDKI